MSPRFNTDLLKRKLEAARKAKASEISSLGSKIESEIQAGMEEVPSLCALILYVYV